MVQEMHRLRRDLHHALLLILDHIRAAEEIHGHEGQVPAARLRRLQRTVSRKIEFLDGRLNPRVPVQPQAT